MIVNALAQLLAAAILLVSTIGCGSSPAAPAVPTPTSLTLTGAWNGTGSDPQGDERMTWRLAIDRCRAAHRRQQVEVAASDAGGATTAETVETVETREREALLWKAIDTLPNKLRMVLVLASIEGHEVKDVASLLGIPKGTVKSRLFAARQRLKEQLQWPLIDTATR